MILGWFTIYADITGILSPISDGIGHFAHIGGFISIGILTYMMGDDDKSKLKKGLIVNVISLIIFFGLYFFFS
jgi:membrane associated rhomboid family serine protease